MIKLGKLEYIGPCECTRQGLVVWENKDQSKRAFKNLCDGRLYKVTPMEINGIAYPSGAKETTWCRSRHYRPDELNDDDKIIKLEILN